MKQTMNSKIIYTKTDEAPALAAASLLPIIRGFTKTAGIEVEAKDISLAGRILGAFPERLLPDQIIPDALAELGELVKEPGANIIKLPNISASLPQLQEAVKELKAQGCDLPDYPEDPADQVEEEIKRRYDGIKGSAVNPVLREGNSDRRAPETVKKHAMNHPHTMGEWRGDSKTHVASMSRGDFYGSERSVVIARNSQGKVELLSDDGRTILLKGDLPLQEGEILDAAVMSRSALRDFLRQEIADAKNRGVLFSVHLKATMMKVSDPIIFGHVVSLFFEDVFEKFAADFQALGINPNNGLGEILEKTGSLPAERRGAILASLKASMAKGPELAMVNSQRGITNLHVPSDVIIDASMPAAIRNSGKMWGPDGNLKDMKAVIPDRSYAGVYQETIDFCRENGAFDPRTMGSVSNVGLMAQKAEEYGSHDKTFEISSPGEVRIIDEAGELLLSQKVEEGDIFRICQVRDASVRDWASLAVKRARAAEVPAVFWLDPRRAHDAELIKKVRDCLSLHDTQGLDIRILPPRKAARLSLKRMKEGKNTISVTGNVLRDYLTDLFPILELGTSAKMLSIVSLMKGGGLFETGAGGSAPKHVRQFLEEGHLRWDSLGEFLALAASLQHLGASWGNEKALVLSEALDQAIGVFLENNRAPSRKVHELDSRGSHFYLACYWARALGEQKKDGELKAIFALLADTLEAREEEILRELDDAQGRPEDLGGYYRPNPEALARAMRPSGTFNAALASLG